MVAIRRAFKNGYFTFGVISLAMTLVVLAFQLRVNVLDLGSDALTWQVISGIILYLGIAYQWALSVARIRNDFFAQQRHYANHRYVGVVLIVIFMGHAISYGHALTSMLALVFLANAITGLLNRDILRIINGKVKIVWFVLHVALSAVMIPLILIHIWSAVAFK